eukprot:12889628-Prorocentrum_lima.AAC.1
MSASSAASRPSGTDVDRLPCHGSGAINLFKAVMPLRPVHGGAIIPQSGLAMHGSVLVVASRCQSRHQNWVQQHK